MNNLLTTILIILVIIWAAGFFAYNANGLIHILIVIALVGFIIRLIRGRSLL